MIKYFYQVIKHMKKAIIVLFYFILLTGAVSINATGQEAIMSDTATNEFTSEGILTPEVSEASAIVTEETLPKLTVHQQIKRKFIEGGAGFMAVILLCFIFGLAIAIERIIYLNLSVTNTKKLLEDIEISIDKQGIDAAKEVCRNTRGPVASIFYQGLDRYDHGLEIVEKSILSYGSVQMGLLEKNLSWISLFIALAPMLGFMGTVIGMIMAFDVINTAGDVTPQLVAGPIGVALITTAAGLIVGAILQVFYSYLLSKIDSIVNTMEDASISFVDILIKFNLKK